LRQRRRILRLLHNTSRGGSRFYDGYSGGDHWTTFSRRNFELTAKLTNTFVHATQAHTARAQPIFSRFFPKFGEDALSVICHLQDREAVVARKTDIGGRAAGMTMHVGKTLLQDAEEGEFGLARKTSELGVRLKRGFDLAALGKSFEIPRDGRAQSNLF